MFGAAPRGDWKPTYSEHDPFHETFTTMAFIAALTKTIKLCSGVLIPPQRQTGLVAKQAAQIDVPCRKGWSRSAPCQWCGAPGSGRHRDRALETVTGSAATSSQPFRCGVSLLMPTCAVYLWSARARMI